MPRLLLTLAALAAFGLAGASASFGRTLHLAGPAVDGQIAQANDKPDAKTTTKSKKKSTRKKTSKKARRKTRYGKLYLTAYAKTGRQAKAARFGSRLRLYTKATKSRKSKKGKRTAGRTEGVEYCGKTYYTTRRGTRWIAAHEKAGHVLVVRRHMARKKFAVVCGKKPKRVKRRSARKKSATKPRTATKADKKS